MRRQCGVAHSHALDCYLVILVVRLRTSPRGPQCLARNRVGHHTACARPSNLTKILIAQNRPWIFLARVSSRARGGACPAWGVLAQADEAALQPVASRLRSREERFDDCACNARGGI
jgi:hypothetical protein